MIILILSLALTYTIGLHIYSDRRQRATINVLRDYAVDLQMTIVELADGRRMDAETIDQLTYDKEAAGFMLATVLKELPEGHMFNFAAEQDKRRKERVSTILKDMRAPRPGIKE